MKRTLWTKFWNDEAGALQSAELIFLGAILVIGIIPGITTLRDAIVTEMADMAAAVNPGHGNGNGNGNGNGHGHAYGHQITTAADLFGGE